MSRQSTLPLDLKEKWVAALRSGKYKQGELRLRHKSDRDGEPDRFCCLGVLCDVSPDLVGLQEYFDVRPAYKYFALDDTADQNAAGLPEVLSRYFGDELPDVTLTPELIELITSRDKTRHLRESKTNLSTLNDAGVPFSVIATVIQELL